MRALVVYESMFGNTQMIAQAVAEGLAQHMSVDVVEVGAAPATVGSDVGLLVVGGPTHAFGLSRATTRADAMGKSTRPLISRGVGIREWLAAVETAAAGAAAAAFDTRIDKPRVPGSAARGAAKRLRHLGFPLACPAESFFVTDTPGPLVPGEVERARDWGEKLATELLPTQPATRSRSLVGPHPARLSARRVSGQAPAACVGAPRAAWAAASRATGTRNGEQDT